MSQTSEPLTPESQTVELKSMKRIALALLIAAALIYAVASWLGKRQP